MKKELLSAMVALTLATPAMAAQTCQVIPQISPADQSVNERDPSGNFTQVKLNGQSSKDTTKFLWAQTGGPAVTLSDPTAAQPTFSAPDVGPLGATLTFRLEASGCTPLQKVSATTTVTVANVVTNMAPIAAATVSPDAVYEGTPLVTLDGSSSSDPDGNQLTYLWSQLTGPAVTLQADGAKATFAAPADVPFPNGVSLSFRLTVSDGTLSNSTDKTVNVQWVNDQPRAVLSCPETVNEGAALVLDGSGSSDGDDGIAAYSWIQLVGTPNAELPLYDPASANKLEFKAPYLDSSNNKMDFRLRVTDFGSLAQEAVCSVKVLDITAPLLGDGPGNLTAEATSAAGADVTFAIPTATDNVDGPLAVSCTPASGATFPLGTSTVTCSVADAAHNGASKEFSVKVQDTTAPAVTAPAPVTTEATGPATEVTIGTATATDAVGVKAITSNAPANYPVGATIVTWSASDEAGNVGSATQSVTVQDTTAPVVTPPAAIVAEATAPLSPVSIGTATATDAVGVKDITSNAPALYPVGTTEVTWSANDEAGNVGSAKQSVTVQDTTAPAVTAPAAVVVEASAPLSPVSIGTATATDAVGVKDITSNAPALYPVGTTEVTWSANDEAGNVGSAKQSVTVQDTTAPAVTVPAAVEVEATGALSPVSIGTATATDAVGVKSITSNAPALYPVGHTEVTWTASDDAGNVSSAKQSVTVKDTTAPVVTAPAALTVEATGPSTSVAIGLATATDAVGVASLTSNAPAVYPVGTTQVTWTAKDAAGNTGTAIQSVTVKDTTAPTLSNVPKGLVLLTGQQATYEPAATDLVDGNLPVVCTPASGSSFALGTTAVTCSAKDAHGNSASAKFDVTMQYGFNGLLAPYDAAKAYKIKSAIPLKWQFTNASGAVLASAGAQPVVTIYQVSNGADSTDAITLDDAGASGLQYDSLTNTWQFNWKTTGLAAGTYNVYIQSSQTGQKNGPFSVKLAK